MLDIQYLCPYKDVDAVLDLVKGIRRTTSFFYIKDLSKYTLDRDICSVVQNISIHLTIE